MSLVFIAAAAAVAPFGDTRWLALHLLLAGGLILAISAVSLMLTVTWSAAPAPAGRWVVAQRTLAAAGAGGIAIARQADWPDVFLAAFGACYLAGLLMLAVLLVTTIRRGVERRFDVAVAFYIAAIAAGVVGVVLGVRMATDVPSMAMRAAHVTSNVLGLVGLVAAGTMPFFAATVGRSKMSPLARRPALTAVLCCMLVGLAFAVATMAADAGSVAAFGLGAYALGIGGVLWLLPRPTRRQWRWAGPRLLALWAGGCWWGVGVAATAVDVWTGDRVAFGGRWVLVIVLGGYAQILWGSLSYLLPMLRGGGPELLSQGFASTRSWVGFAAANVVAVSLAAGLARDVTVAALVVWVLDSAWRIARVGTSRASRPSEEPR